ncbi:hypothetical protein [Prosthecobacter sp.]
MVLCLAMAQGFALADEAELRRVVTKGLGYVAKAGEVWIEEKNCNGCHHLPEMLWSHREARRRGFAIDQAKYDEWLAWAKPKVKGIAAGVEQVAFMTLALPQQPAEEAHKLMTDALQKDGTWKPAGQFVAQRRATDEAKLNSMRIFLLALAGTESGRKTADEARAKSAAWMAKTQAANPPKSIETVAFQALYAQKFGLQEERAAALAALLKHQREDGGWSWVMGEAQSDALATGEVLYALHELGDAGAKDAITRGQQWLMRTQAEDGSWPVKVGWYSQNDRTDPKKPGSLKAVTGIYTDWAAGWATLALLQGLPVQEQEKALASP